MLVVFIFSLPQLGGGEKVL